MSALIPPSVKLSVACCHIDFRTKGVSAVPDASLDTKLDRINSILASSPSRPQLIVFPEGADCVLVRRRAEHWATSLGAVTICGTQLVGDRIVGAVVVPDGATSSGFRVETFEKQHLSPYDAVLAGRQLIEGTQGGLLLRVPSRAANGAPVEVSVLVLICYDFRFGNYRALDFNEVQVVVVPMFDEATLEPETIGERLARRHYVRTFLVNKGTRFVSAAGPGVPWLMRLSKWVLDSPTPVRAFAQLFAKLPSAAYGPMAPAFAKSLKSSGVHQTNAAAARIWRFKGEAVTLGVYEVGQGTAPGHDTAYGAGYFYTEVRHANVSS